MEKKYVLLLIVIIIFIYIYHIHEKEYNVNNVYLVVYNVYKRVSTTIQNKYNNYINNKKEGKPITIILKEQEESKKIKPSVIKKDMISPNPENTTEYKFVEEDPKTAWADINVSQHPKYHTPKFEDKVMNLGGFFNKDKFFQDKTSPYSTDSLPDRCHKGKNNEILCNYNNKLQLIPPKLIQDKENNPVLNSIGEVRGEIFKLTNSNNVNTVNNQPYQVWTYDNEKLINGGNFYNNIKPSSPDNEEYLLIDSVNKVNYSF